MPPTTLNLFKKSHLSIIYGRNGSGKTTIAKSIRQLVGKDTEQPNEDGYTSYSFSSDSVIPEYKKDSVFIFDEEFVRLNVRTQGKGLETIVMMGEQVDLNAQMAKKKEDKYNDERLLVIDDPVSSFDNGNRLGIMSLLRYQYANIQKGNPNSRMLVLTHDLSSAFDLVKIRSTLNDGDQNFLELISKSLSLSTSRNPLSYIYKG